MQVFKSGVFINTINLKFIVFIFFITSFSQNLLAQTLQVLSIQETTRNNTFDYGYTLDGIYMSGAARLKLTNPANFGPSGTIGYTLNITDSYGAPGSLPGVAILNTYDIIFIGWFNNPNAWTAAELSTLKAWSSQPKKVLIIAERQYFANQVGISFGFPGSSVYNNPSSPTDGDFTTNVKIFSGLFGAVTYLYQSPRGASQSYFNSTCSAIALTRDANGNATMLYSAAYNDVLIADVNSFTTLQPTMMTAGGTISTDPEKAWGNLWAWAVREATTGTTPDPSGGGTTTIFQTLPLCSTANTAFISLSGQTGNILRWETSTNGGATWTPIYSSSNPLTYQNAVNNQQFRAIISANANCASSTSKATTITTSTAPCSVTNTGAGTLDCSKTQISPAPVFGTASQTDLIITVNVTTAGAFTPTVSGSGMSLANAAYSITTTKTGSQTFHVPINYDGTTALTMLSFTMALATPAAGCTADLTKGPKNAITSIWTLDCVPTAGPSLK